MGLKQENYTVIQGWMVNDLDLKGNELIIYSIIYGFSQSESQCFTGSLGYLEEWTRASKPTVIAALKSLQSKGLITKDEYMKNGVKFCRYRANLTGGKEILPGGGKESLPGGGKEILPNNTNTNKNNIFNNQETSISSSEKPKKTISFLVSLFSDEFEEVWKMYPKKQGKSEALKAYAKARNEGTSQEEIMESLKKYVSYTQGRESKYIKNGSTWFNQKCWEDKYEDETGMSTHGFDYAKLEELANRKSLGL